MPTLTELVVAPDRKLSADVHISGVNIQPTNPTDPLGIPGYSQITIRKSFDNPVPVCQFSFPRTSRWITPGMDTLVSVGYNGINAMLFNGYVSDRAKGVAHGELNALGQSGRVDRAASGPETILTGLTVKQAITNILVKAGVTSYQVDNLTFVLGSVVEAKSEQGSLMNQLQPLMDINGCMLYETNNGTVIVKIIDEFPAPTAYKRYTTIAGEANTARVLDGGFSEDPTWPRSKIVATGATIEGTDDEPSTPMTATAVLSAAGRAALFKPPLPAGTDVLGDPNFELIDVQSVLEEAALRELNKYARIPGSLKIDVPGDPTLDLGMTLDIAFDEVDQTGRYFVHGITHSIDVVSGYRTTLDLRGGDQIGGTLTLAPVMVFSVFSERENIGGTEYLILTLNASGSYDPDGSIVSYNWSFNNGVPSASGKIITLALVESGMTSPLTITLTGIDNTDATTVVSQDQAIGAALPAPKIPNMFAAIDNKASASPDGGKTWNDQTLAGCTQVTARPADGSVAGEGIYGTTAGALYLTTNYCQSALTQVLAAVGSPITDLAWDYRDTKTVWALTADCRLYVSRDYGRSFGLYEAIRSASIGSAGVGSGSGDSISGSYVGDGTASKVITFATAGFDPELVMVHSQGITGTTMWRGRHNTGTNSQHMSSSPDPADGIIAMGLDSFTVGINVNVNDAGVTYAWTAFRGVGSVKTGSYVGDGLNGHAITGIGFQPAVLVTGRSGGVAGLKTIDMTSPDENTDVGNSDPGGQQIDSLDADGFTLQVAGANVYNTAATTFHYFALGGSAVAHGSYVGDASTSFPGPTRHIEAGFLPGHVWVKQFVNSDFNDPQMRQASNIGDASQKIINTPTLNSNNIISFDAAGFTIGTSFNVNASGKLYVWWAFRGEGATTGAAFPSALGSGIGLPYGNTTVYVFGGTGTGYPLMIYDNAQNHVWGSLAIGGELLADLPGPAGLVVGGGASRTLGESVLALRGGAGTMVYFGDSTQFTDGSGWKRAIGLDAGLTNPQFVVPSTLAGDYKLFFDNSDVWNAVDALHWTVRRNVFPAGVQAHDGIWLGDYGIDNGGGIGGIYLFACEEVSAKTRGIFKSTDDVFTTAVIRPTTGTFTTTWSSPSIGRKIRVSFAAGSVAATARIALASGVNISAPHRVVVRSDDNLSWKPSTVPDGITEGGGRVNLYCVTNNIWFINYDQVPSGGTGFLGPGFGNKTQVTVDGGLTWTPSTISQGVGTVPGSPAFSHDGLNHGAVAFAPGADGTIWGLTHNRLGGYTESRIWSSSDGLSWTQRFVWEGDKPPGEPDYPQLRRLVPHPNDSRIIYAWGGDDVSSDDPRQMAFTIDGGASWTKRYAVATFPTYESSHYPIPQRMFCFASGRLLCAWEDALDAGSSAYHQSFISTSDDRGASWTVRKQTGGFGIGTVGGETKYILAGINPLSGKAVLYVFSNNDVNISEVWTSSDQGQTWQLLTVPSIYTTASDVVDSTGVYDPSSDSLYMADNASGVAPDDKWEVWKLTPVTNAGVWVDLRQNIEVATITENLAWDTVLALIPQG